MKNDPEKDDKFLYGLETGMIERYYHYIDLVNSKKCALKKVKTPISSLNEPFNISMQALKEAVSHIKMDIKILHLRRGELIEDFHTSEGKIAGIIAFRFAKTPIINISKFCNNGCNVKCLARLNIEIAIRCACDYIHKKYPELPKGIRQELVYTIRHRHVNQEMIGLVFDALMGAPPHVNESTEKIAS